MLSWLLGFLLIPVTTLKFLNSISLLCSFVVERQSLFTLHGHHTIDTILTWKHHIGELTFRMNKACYAIRSFKPFMSLDVLRSTYF